jgi:hypothetical protein
MSKPIVSSITYTMNVSKNATSKSCALLPFEPSGYIDNDSSMYIYLHHISFVDTKFNVLPFKPEASLFPSHGAALNLKKSQKSFDFSHFGIRHFTRHVFLINNSRFPGAEIRKWSYIKVINKKKKKRKK